ncbi:DUF3099 domain-containing protein [Brevibacterium album]|uniref:DUF3099 domain-containing protein n=1 Tax=Brevibacterium album TaxID=417948 RepID=UPI00042126B3|nr:DUF3099 domain-containing protein [Brevibacterium album]
MVERRRPTSVTQAQESAEKDYRERVRRYTISMIIRVICLLLAFVVTGWLRWVMIAGAVVLPYVAVLIANAANERFMTYEMAEYRPPAPAELDAAAQEPAAEEPETIEGEVVEGERAEDGRAEDDGRGEGA